MGVSNRISALIYSRDGQGRKMGGKSALIQLKKLHLENVGIIETYIEPNRWRYATNNTTIRIRLETTATTFIFTEKTRWKSVESMATKSPGSFLYIAGLMVTSPSHTLLLLFDKFKSHFTERQTGRYRDHFRNPGRGDFVDKWPRTVLAFPRHAFWSDDVLRVLVKASR